MDDLKRSRAGELARAAWRLPIVRPVLVVLLLLFVTVPAVRASLLLPVRTGLTELVPESRPSVTELERVSRRLAGSSTLIVVAESPEVADVRRFVDDMAPRIRALGPRYVTGVDEGNRALRRFTESHKYLYAELGELRKLRDDVVARYDYEVSKRAGLDLGIADEPPGAALDAAALRDRLEAKWNQAERNLGDGYYLAEGGHLGSIVVRAPFETGDPRVFELENKIRALWSGSELASAEPRLELLFTGNLVTSAEEHRAVTRDLAHVGAAGIFSILAVVFLFFWRVRVIVALSIAIAVACFWAFAVAFLTVGYLNTATGFLVSIIVGNGINFGIIGSARYLEFRFRDRLPARLAVSAAMKASAPGTLTAALCASVAYGSLALTDFRGFRHFGIIGGAGMLLSWFSSYALLPALLLLGERIVPTRDDSSRVNRFRARFADPFVYLANRFGPLLLTGAAALGVLSAALSVRYVIRDPLEYDLGKLRTDTTDPGSARVLARRIEGSVDRLTREGRALLTDRFDQVAPLVAELERRRDAAPPDRKPFDRVVSVFDLLPVDQPERVALASDIVDRLRRARKRHIIGDADWAKLEPELPQDLRVLGVADLPGDVAWPFEERDGTRGRIVYLVPAAGRSLSDAHYLAEWADAFREVRLPNGDVIRGSGDAVILADMLDDVRIDAPKAMAISVATTLLVILVAFRARRAGWLALLSVFLGIAWLVALLAVTGVRINFLNFVALPISVGVGADYSVNVLTRYELDRGRGVERGIRETGGAVVLCSLTTLFGYGALTLSTNGAVRSFGIVGAFGELAMLLSAMLVLPALLFERRAAWEPKADRRAGGTLAE